MAKERHEFMIFDSSRICPVCQREFCTPDPEMWAFKQMDCRGKNRVYFCSWGCMRKYEFGEVDLTGRGMKLSTKKRKIWQALDDGLSVKEISTLLDVPVHQVKYYKDKWVPKGENESK